ncbi:MAG: hypothetical protein HY521_13195 [Proteobacteria bacterium]|nr:hypothetical protein [Pseudomonadota bacterium]
MVPARGPRRPARSGWIWLALLIAAAALFAYGAGAGMGEREIVTLRGELESLAARVRGLERENSRLAEALSAARLDAQMASGERQLSGGLDVGVTAP